MPDLKLVGGTVAGLEAGASTLSPIEIMHRMGEQWIKGANPQEKAETLRVLLKHGRSPNALLQILEGEMGEKVVTMPLNRIPKAVMNAAGSARSQSKFTQTLSMVRGIKNTGASPGELRKLFGITMKAAEQAGLSPNALDALRRLGPEKVFKAGPTSVARVYDIATKEPSAQRLWRWATKGTALAGRKALGTGPTQALMADVRTQIDALEGIAKESLQEQVSAAEGAFGKTKAAVKGGAARAAEVVSPKGLSAAEEGTLQQLTKAGAKGLGRGAKLARGLGGVGALITAPLLGHELYDSLVGKSKRARAALIASRSGGTASVSQELMHDILDKRADLEARRAALGRDPKLMQQITQALGGSSPKNLTTSERGFGVSAGGQQTSPGDMDKLLAQLLGEMRGM